MEEVERRVLGREIVWNHRSGQRSAYTSAPKKDGYDDCSARWYYKLYGKTSSFPRAVIMFIQ